MVGWILLALLGLIVVAFFIPVRLRVEYLDNWHITVFLFGGIPVWRYPVPEKPKDKPKAPAEVAEGTPAQAGKKPSLADEVKALFREEGIGGVMGFFGKLVHLLKTTLCSLVHFITVRKLVLCVRVGGEEADKTAVRYGQISTALTVSLTTLSQLVRIKKPIVRVLPDFLSETTQVKMRLIAWVWPFGLVGVGVAAACKFLMLWMKTPQKGVQDTKTQPVSK